MCCLIVLYAGGRPPGSTPTRRYNDFGYRSVHVGALYSTNDFDDFERGEESDVNMELNNERHLRAFLLVCFPT